jgi:hypothetical protein
MMKNAGVIHPCGAEESKSTYQAVKKQAYKAAASAPDL